MKHWVVEIMRQMIPNLNPPLGIILLPPINNTVPNFGTASTGVCRRFEAPETPECDFQRWI